MRKFLGLLLIAQCLFMLTMQAQNNEIKKEKWHWDNALKQDTSAGYVQVIKVDNVLYISGAVARDVTPEGITRLYQALEKSLKALTQIGNPQRPNKLFRRTGSLCWMN